MNNVNELNHKALQLSFELNELKNSRFSKFLHWKINKKEAELKNVNEMRSKLLCEQSFLDKFKQDKIKIKLPSIFDSITYEKIAMTTSSMRISMAENWGFLVPPIRITDSESIKPNEFEIIIKGGIKRDFIQIEEYVPEDEICNHIISKVQTYLFDNAESLFGVWDMYKYIKAGLNNEDKTYEDYLIIHNGPEMFAYFLSYIIPSLLNERYCIKNINFIMDTIYSMALHDDKDKEKILSCLKSKLKKYPEEIYFSDWTIKDFVY